MIRNLRIPDYQIHETVFIIGALSLTLLILQLITDEEKHYSALIIATGVWSIFTV